MQRLIGAKIIFIKSRQDLDVVIDSLGIVLLGFKSGFKLNAHSFNACDESIQRRAMLAGSFSIRSSCALQGFDAGAAAGGQPVVPAPGEGFLGFDLVDLLAHIPGLPLQAVQVRDINARRTQVVVQLLADLLNSTNGVFLESLDTDVNTANCIITKCLGFGP